jgi:tRNA threonylcarbamoyladenosine modification (KEOPS) complex  Pcc1 subunit
VQKFTAHSSLVKKGYIKLVVRNILCFFNLIYYWYKAVNNVKDSLGNRAELMLSFNDAECNLTEVIYNSIFAEVVNPANVGKISTKIISDKCSIKIYVEADTISHLRAFLNSIFYLINTALEVIKLGEGLSSSK